MIRAITASVAPSESDPASPMMIWAGWTLNHRKPSSAPMISAHRSAIWGCAGTLSRAMIRKRDEGERERAAGQPVEAVGDVDAVGRGHDRERGEEDVDDRVDRDVADERDPDARDLVRVLDLVRDDQRDDRLPQQLLADADPLAGSRVEVVVGGAQQAHERERRERGDDAALGRPAQDQEDDDHDDDHEQAAHRRRAPLDHVALRALLADLLAEAGVSQEAHVGRHQDHDEGEREQQALDQLQRHGAGSGPPSAAHEAVDDPLELDATRRLDQHRVARTHDARRAAATAAAASATAMTEPAGMPAASAPSTIPRARPPGPPSTTIRASSTRPAASPDLEVARVVGVAQLAHLAQDGDPVRGREAGQQLQRGEHRARARRCSCRRR